MKKRRYEIVVFGATGFTGGLVAEYLNLSKDYACLSASRSISSMKRRSTASLTVGAIFKIVSNCEIEISFITERCKPVRTKVPPEFLQSLFATKIALRPEESQ